MSKTGVTDPSTPTSVGAEANVVAMDRTGAQAATELSALDMAPPSELREYGGIDPLTGVMDRAGFDAAIEREVARAGRHGEELTLVLLNLDLFTSLNETYGPDTGDAVLRRVGDALLRIARESDTPARFKGDEFAILLPACKRHESFTTVNRIRNAIAAVESPRPISVSAGVATYPAHAHTPEGLVKAAGEALYEAKLAGRDRARRSTRGSLYRANERRAALGKPPVPRLKDRRKNAPAGKPVALAPKPVPALLVTAKPPPAAIVVKPEPEHRPEPVESVTTEPHPETMLVTAKPPPADAQVTLNYSVVEAQLRQIATARMAS